jgi:Domain of unknown function (DUF4143)
MPPPSPPTGDATVLAHRLCCGDCYYGLIQRDPQGRYPGHGEQLAKTTTIAYRDVLGQIWLLDPVPGWLPVRNQFTRLAQAPRHHVADPALAARLLGASPQSLLAGDQHEPTIPRDGSLLGRLVESLIALSLRVYAQAAEAYRPGRSRRDDSGFQDPGMSVRSENDANLNMARRVHARSLTPAEVAKSLGPLQQLISIIR